MECCTHKRAFFSATKSGIFNINSTNVFLENHLLHKYRYKYVKKIENVIRQ